MSHPKGTHANTVIYYLDHAITMEYPDYSILSWLHSFQSTGCIFSCALNSVMYVNALIRWQSQSCIIMGLTW